MLNLEKLETRQVGLRLAKHLVDDIDNLTAKYNISRSTFISKAIEQVVEEQKQQQKEQEFYKRLDSSVAQMKQMIDEEIPSHSLENLINELED
jgi:metal-responsive CopG/Arc/MetJ family transcriptional regulator